MVVDEGGFKGRGDCLFWVSIGLVGVLGLVGLVDWVEKAFREVTNPSLEIVQLLWVCHFIKGIRKFTEHFFIILSKDLHFIILRQWRFEYWTFLFLHLLDIQIFPFLGLFGDFRRVLYWNLFCLVIQVFDFAFSLILIQRVNF